MIEFDTINKISPTPGWMSETYDKLNDWLFGGRLGQCDFNVFTKGKGSTGNRLGFFHLVNKSPYHHLKYKKSSRRIFLLDTISQQELFVNYDNFYDLCHPEICLNGNYKATEYAFASILLHEMCHYYTYMYGYIPVQGHGTEFRNIGFTVVRNSNGYFQIQRLERDEVVSQMELNSELQAQREKKKQNNINNSLCILVYKNNGQIRLVKTKLLAVESEVLSLEAKKPDTLKILLVQDPTFVELCMNNGYGSNSRSYRYWNVEREPFVQNIDNYQYKVLYKKQNTMDEEMIRRIVRETIEKHVELDEQGFSEDGEITPDMNLSVKSPLEA